MLHQKSIIEKWKSMNLLQQLANIGSEVVRTINWRTKNSEYSKMAFERALELMDLTISDSKNINRLEELTRVRETLVDYFVFENIYKSSDELWSKYFLAFNYAANNEYRSNL